MMRMPIKTIAIGAAIALALVLLTLPLSSVAQASSPKDGWMMHDGGAARFEPNELPNPFVRDFDGDCEWWQYELKGGKYVRTYCLCRYGDAEVDYRDHVRSLWARSATMVMGELQPVTTGEVTQAAEAAPSTAGDMTQAVEQAPAAEELSAEEPAAEEPAAEEPAVEEPAAEEPADAAATEPAETAEMPAADIVDTLTEAGGFSVLLEAVNAAGLSDALRGEGPFTVFAPNDAAFMALPEGALDELMADPSADLTQTLLYHVVNGEIPSSDLTDGMELETLQGSLITVSIDGDTVTVSGANVLFPDIEIANGVVHVIDSVMPVPAE